MVRDRYQNGILSFTERKGNKAVLVGLHEIWGTGFRRGQYRKIQTLRVPKFGESIRSRPQRVKQEFRIDHEARRGRRSGAAKC